MSRKTLTGDIYMFGMIQQVALAARRVEVLEVIRYTGEIAR